MVDAMAGAIIAGYAVAALLFLRFWRDTRDRLFATFAGAFALLSVQRALLLAVPGSPAGQDPVPTCGRGRLQSPRPALR